MNARRAARRHGFTLPEMLVAMVLLSIVGAAIVRILVLQTHLFQKATAQRATRVVTRSAMNVINSDLRMIEPSNGIVSASSTALLVRAPYALGIVCATVTSVASGVKRVTIVLQLTGITATPDTVIVQRSSATAGNPFNTSS